MYKQAQGVRLPPTKYRNLDIPPTSPKAANNGQVVEKDEDDYSINTKARLTNEKITKAFFGPSRQAIMEIDGSIKKDRAINLSREGGFTLDCVSIAAGDKGLKLPPYNPFYDPKQHLFLKSPERCLFVLYAYL
jgi:hypothetical protein